MAVLGQHDIPGGWNRVRHSSRCIPVSWYVCVRKFFHPPVAQPGMEMDCRGEKTDCPGCDHRRF